jgi:hypothetical protein
MKLNAILMIISTLILIVHNAQGILFNSQIKSK